MSTMWKPLGILAVVTTFGGLAPVAVAQTAPTPTFTKDIAAIFQEKCEACHRPDSIAPMSLVTYEEARPWARSIKARVAARQMPPWHIDKTIGIQEFKNDRSLSDERDRHDRSLGRRGRAEGRPEGHAAAEGVAERAGLELRRSCSARPTRPDHQVRRRGRRRPARTTRGGSRSSRPGSPSRAGCARSRSGPAPSRAARSPITRSPACSRKRPTRSRPTPSIPNGNPLPGTFMEWAVGKQGEMMRPNSGKLMLPGSKIVWDIHYSNGGEDITDQARARHLLLPEGPGAEVPPGAAPDGRDQRRRRRHPAEHGEGHRGLLRDARAGASRASSRTCTCAARRCRWKRILPNGQTQVLSHVADFNFNWHNSYVYADDAAPLLPKGTILKVTAWHDNTAAKKSQPRSERLGGLRRSHRGRNGARVGERHLHERRRLPRRGQGSSRGAGPGHTPAAVTPAGPCAGSRGNTAASPRANIFASVRSYASARFSSSSCVRRTGRSHAHRHVRGVCGWSLRR